ncbi:MAG: septum formation inhibitor Maf [Acidobacteriia bacterium 12-62-4]|nr:MAG: septum formation inhibitor Maf [Acidobacteriia bacterium 12-62-4]
MLILASQSPRRREILERAGIPFTVRVADVDESLREGEAAQSYVRRLATRKAVAAGRPAEVVLGADTTVVVDGEILAKPTDEADAARMLRLLSGRSHEVITGTCLKVGGQLYIDAETTVVRFMAMHEAEIAAYVATGEPMDKAGAYAIQGGASRYIDRIEGCYWNVVGLPVAKIYAQLRRHGVV